MYFQQFYLESLGHASYFIGSEETGEALVLDVRRDVDLYFETSLQQGMQIKYAADTHQHNDYMTGICELPERGNIQLIGSARADLGYPVREMGDGDRLEMGEILFEVLQTPGHTPEHISFLVTDRARGEDPVLLLSGGSLLVDDVGRPDLLGSPEEVQRHAQDLCQTLKNKILPLPDHVQVYPTHVAGSLCGGNIGSRLSTTIGYERRMNQLLASLTSEDEFAKQCLDLSELPAVPSYWPRMRKANKQGPPLLGVLADPPPLTVSAFKQWQQAGAIVLDCRSPEAFASHIPGSINVGLGSSFTIWAGSVLPPDVPLLLVLERSQDLWDVCWQLIRIGYDLPQGWLAGGMKAWRTAAAEIEQLTLWTVQVLRDQIERDQDLFVLDVRQRQEWKRGHLASATQITGADLPQRLEEVPRDRPIAVVCGSGYRASVAASLLLHHGWTKVVNVLGGMSAWKKAGYEVTRS
ncbi:MBL fold metallo-hydrolase [Lyngbya confervoides]|uniref:MBL fold metallo-hydrolase n=1 Tax=Lyngbya confervoides BDU141951 TaxID=1574623 RepID=A0ABD4T527_9CYAN|nr:MBL fold metallo-hydrolase [Lyngbya confervoides]MCM1983761.1 MBL fold metallo-hydrolase [Lyngbya confervoides BDU141951]